MRRLYLAWMSLLVAAGCQTTPRVDQAASAQSALEQKRFDEALSSSDAYLRETPGGTEAPRVQYLRGRALESRTKANESEMNSDLREARVAYERALALNPEPPLRSYVLTSLGNVAFWLGDYPAAERHWIEAYSRLADEDLKAWVLYRLGLTQQRQGKFAIADSTFADVQKRYANNEAADRAKGHQGAKAFFVQVGAFEQAAGADKLVGALKSRGLPAQRMLKAERNLHVAMVGPAKTYADALALKQRLGPDHADAIIIP